MKLAESPKVLKVRPLPGKGKLQDCRGAWSDAAICPASGAAANRRGPVWEMLWGERRGTGIILAQQNDRVPHARTQRPEPIPHDPQAGQHLDRCSRDEPVSLARRWARSCDRATPAQEDRAR